MDDEDREQWWTAPANTLTLLDYLASEEAYNKADMVAALEKPWKYTPEFERAYARLEAERDWRAK